MRKALPSHQGDPSSIPGRAICDLSYVLILCCARRVFQTIGFSPLWKNVKHFRSLAVLSGHNGLMWLAAKGALECQLLQKDVVAASFAIQLLAASKVD